MKVLLSTDYILNMKNRFKNAHMTAYTTDWLILSMTSLLKIMNVLDKYFENLWNFDKIILI